MATTSDRRNVGGAGGAGVKISRNRRIPAASRTPYSRPPNPPHPKEETENPNWFSGLIYPAKMIASGAGKIISFFGPDSSSSSSGAVSSENDDEEEEVANEVSSQRDDRSNKVLSPFSKSDNKHAIEQLVMQEIFTREEGNELVRLIKSRIVDTNGTLDESTSNMRITTIMEARKWLQQKKSGSKKKMGHELHSTTLATPSKVNGIGKGSPVDMAKSYMQNRPAWASSLKHTDIGSPRPLGILNYKEETPKSNLRSSEMKRSSLSSGSWNILEEVRKVRSKATEELLAATPLTKTVLSSLSPEINQPQDSLIVNIGVEGAEPMHDRPQNILPDVSAIHPSVANQDGDAVQSTEHQECHKSVDLKSDEDNQVNELRSTSAENGFPSTASSLIAGQNATQKPEPSEEVNGNLVSSDQAGIDVHVDANLNPEQDTAADVSNPNLNPTDSVVNGSENSSSMQLEDLSQELIQPVSENPTQAKPKPKPKANAPERKSRGYTRRGRGRGK